MSSILLLTMTMACSADDVLQESFIDDSFLHRPDSMQSSVLLDDTLRILDIGNSYTEDYTYHLSAIADNLGDDMGNVCYYNLVRASGSFKTWYDCYYGKDKLKYYCEKVLGNIDQNVPTGDFEPYDSAPLHQILSKQWDLIILHPASDYATNYSQWLKKDKGGYLNRLFVLLCELQPKAQFAFVLTHSYEHTYANNKERSTYVRWQNISTATQQLMNEGNAFRYLIPYGTAIENLRLLTNTEHDFTRDGTHLGRGLARYTAALTVYQTLFYPRTGHSIVDCTLTYSCQQWEINDSKYADGCIDVTPDNAPLAIEAALKACETPFECR